MLGLAFALAAVAVGLVGARALRPRTHQANRDGGERECEAKHRRALTHSARTVQRSSEVATRRDVAEGHVGPTTKELGHPRGLLGQLLALPGADPRERVHSNLQALAMPFALPEPTNHAVD